MQTMMKHRKAIAFVLTLAMLFSIVPVAAWADDSSDTTTAYVTIVDQGEIVMAHQKVTVTTGSAIIDDFLKQAHEDSYEGGASAGYASAEGSYGLSITKLWGKDKTVLNVASASFGYYVNNASAWSLADSVKDGDHIVAFVYSDQTGWSDKYSYFNTDAITITTGSNLALQLNAA